METEQITLAEAIEKKCLPKYNRKLTKRTKELLDVIGGSLPEYTYVQRLAKVTGKDLIEDDADKIGEDDIDPSEEYTVFEKVKTKVNHSKRLRKAWKMSNSPFNVILYGFKFMDNSYKNEWIEIINETFKTNYPLAYLDDETEKEWDELDKD